MLIVLNSFHADTAMIAFGLLVAGSLIVAWRTDAAAGAVGAAAAWYSWCSPNGRSAPIPTCWCCPAGRCRASAERHRRIGLPAPDIGGDLRRGIWPRGIFRAGPLVEPIIPVIWSAAAVFTPLALLVALYARIAHLDQSIPFAILAVIPAAAYAAATEILSKREERPGLPAGIALFATGALAALALALTFALEKGWLTIALALMSLGTAWISMQRPIPFLRSLAAILAGIVVLRIGYEPRIVGDAVGTTLIFNWLLWGTAFPRHRSGRQHLPAPRRRRCAATRGGIRRHPVHGAAGVHGNPPCRQQRRRLSPERGPDRGRAADLRRAGDGDRAGAFANTYRKLRSHGGAGLLTVLPASRPYSD